MDDRERQEIEHIAKIQMDRLRRFRLFLSARSDRVREETRPMLLKQCEAILAEYESILRDLANPSPAHLRYRAAHDRLRSLQGISGALLASTDWQSPSYRHALVSEAGTQTGKISGTVNDYKRDHHMDAGAYEDAFVQSYIDRRVPLPIHAYACTSGMAAFSTILTALQMQGITDGPMLLGRNSYFENKILLLSLYPDRVFEVDEMNANELVEAVREIQPTVIFLDSLCNSEILAMPDLPSLIRRIAQTVEHETYLVLDNTGLTCTYQPLQDMPLVPGPLKLIVFESLNKHHQFGMDRVTGGIIWAQSFTGFGLPKARMHAGTMMPDASSLSLPWPDRNMLSSRLQTLERNALQAARALDAHIRAKDATPFSHVVYPGLETHPGNAWNKDRPFHGASLVLALKRNLGKVRIAQAFIDHAIREAARVHMDLSAGTSFGLNTTRVYLTALHASGTAKPFLRISMGTEQKEDADKLVDVFKAAIDRIRGRVI